MRMIYSSFFPYDYTPPAPRRPHPLRNLVMLTWFKNLLSKIPPSIEKPLWALIVAGLTFLAAKYGVVIPAAVNNENYVVVPTDPTFLGAAPAQPNVVGAAGDRVHPVLLAIARHKAAKQYATEHDGLTHPQALKLAMMVPDADITAAMVEQGLVVKGNVVGGPLTNLLDWISTHPEQVQAIIKIILMLLPLFADAHPMPGMLDKPFDDIRICQVPYPLAWTRPALSLAC